MPLSIPPRHVVHEPFVLLATQTSWRTDTFLARRQGGTGDCVTSSSSNVRDGACHAHHVTIIELKNCGDDVRVCINLRNSHLWSVEMAWTSQQQFWWPWMAPFPL